MITKAKVKQVIILAKANEKERHEGNESKKEMSTNEDILKIVKKIIKKTGMDPAKKALVEYLQALTEDDCKDLLAIMYAGKGKETDSTAIDNYRKANGKMPQEVCISQLLSKSGYVHNLSSYLSEGIKLI
jgi:hypothetical protein